MLGKWAIKERKYGKAFNAMMFRKTTVSSEDAIDRSKALFGPLGGKFNEGRLTWKMPHGGRIGFGYLDNMSDAEGQQGKNLTDVWIEEMGQYADPSPIMLLFGALRSAHNVPVQLIGTANPGGAGQHWIAERYGLIPFPAGPQLHYRELPDGSKHAVGVIPSRIQDNKILLDSDPGYVSRLHMVGGAALVKAWLEGDWSAVEGAFFDISETKHMVQPFEIPRDWHRFRSGDWGSARPFSFGWWAMCPDAFQTPCGKTIPRGAIVRYREWYGCVEGKPNKGLKLTAEEVGRGIKERERGEEIGDGVLDPAAFAEDGGPSLASRINGQGVFFRRADNKRVSQRGAMGGWDMMRHRADGANGVPMLYVFKTCRDWWRTVPVLQHDEKRPEDLDTEAEDHAADETRYACMSRPWLAPRVETRKEPFDAYAPAKLNRDRAEPAPNDGLFG